MGNPHVLVHDEHWSRLVHHCITLNAYRGCDPPSMTPSLRSPPSTMSHNTIGGPIGGQGADDSRLDSLVDVFERLRIGGEEPPEEDPEAGGASYMQTRENPEWRNFQ